MSFSSASTMSLVAFSCKKNWKVLGPKERRRKLFFCWQFLQRHIFFSYFFLLKLHYYIIWVPWFFSNANLQILYRDLLSFLVRQLYPEQLVGEDYWREILDSRNKIVLCQMDSSTKASPSPTCRPTTTQV